MSGADVNSEAGIAARRALRLAGVAALEKGAGNLVDANELLGAELEAIGRADLNADPPAFLDDFRNGAGTFVILRADGAGKFDVLAEWPG